MGECTENIYEQIAKSRGSILISENITADICRVMPEWAWDTKWIGYGVRGSLAHGTFIPSDEPDSVDDIDLWLVYRHKPGYYGSLDGYDRKREHFDTAGNRIDVSAMEVRKFVSLLRKGNPNVHSWLWTEARMFHGPLNNLALRKRLLTRRTLGSIAGYAKGQMELMKRGVTTRAYMGEKRRQLVERYGYDCKAAAHAVRLLLQGIILARELELVVRLPDESRRLVCDVKSGGFTFDKARRLLDDLNVDFMFAYDRSELTTPDDSVYDEYLRDLLTSGHARGIYREYAHHTPTFYDTEAGKCEISVEHVCGVDPDKKWREEFSPASPSVRGGFIPVGPRRSGGS